MRLSSQKKRREILEAAMPVFLKRGFQATTMSDVAAAAGGSKQTLYRYFTSKEELFVSVLKEVCSEVIVFVLETATGEKDLDFKSALRQLGMQFLSIMNTTTIIAFRRIVIAEGAHTGLGRQIYENGAKRGLLLMADYFEDLMTKGLMKRASSWNAAVQFAGLCECGELMQYLEGARGSLSPAEVQASVEAAVSMFASHYAAV